MNTPKVSIIVPVLNEAGGVQEFLRRLRANTPAAEIIVVDGGSSDGTPSLADGLCDQVIESAPGRAVQMNEGARRARGGILWFLHADCEVPPSCLSDMTAALDDPRVGGGYFRVRLPRPEWIYRVHDSFGHHVGVLLRVRCGDHGLFCRRAAFDALGGYPDVPIMEDVEFYRALHRLGHVSEIPARLIVSTRRHEQVGVYRYTAACSAAVALYCLGLPLEFLARSYASMVALKPAAAADPDGNRPVARGRP